jgi:hypothetical protein
MSHYDGAKFITILKVFDYGLIILPINSLVHKVSSMSVVTIWNTDES